MHYLRSNNTATKELMEFIVENGWVVFFNENKTYGISEVGHRYLVELRPLLYPVYATMIDSFSERTR